MEVERYKMIYTKIYTDKLLDISRSIEDQNDEFILNIYKEILSYDIRILGSDFVKNNKNKAKLIINNKKYALKEFINQKGSTSDEIKINILLNKDLLNISSFFKNCFKLIEFSFKDNILDIDNEETKDFEENFGCKIDYNEDINSDIYNNARNDTIYSNYSTITSGKENYNSHDDSIIENIEDSLIFHQYNNYFNISYTFFDCVSLKSLPDISKWNTSNVFDMSVIFAGCSSLSSLPDISKWNTSNVIDMSGMFFNCSSLLSLPDISKWNINNVIDMKSMFWNCSSLTSLPDISKWDNIDIDSMFSNCISLSSLPNIYGYDIFSKNKMFINCL